MEGHCFGGGVLPPTEGALMMTTASLSADSTPVTSGRDKAHPTRRAVLAAAGGAAALAAASAWRSSSLEVERANRRLAGRSQVMVTAAGQLEYAIAGDGPPLMMIHGTGGGFDQGLSFSSGIIARGHKVIAPSRFGYLRSDYPADASSEHQADVLVSLPIVSASTGCRWRAAPRAPFRPFSSRSGIRTAALHSSFWSPPPMSAIVTPRR